MSVLDLLERLIREHGSAGVLREQLELARQQAVYDQKKFDDHNASVELQHAQTVAELQAQIADLKTQLNAQPLGDICPFCKKPTAKLSEIKPDATFGVAGLKRGFYECTACGKKFDKKLQL